MCPQVPNVISLEVFHTNNTATAKARLKNLLNSFTEIVVKDYIDKRVPSIHQLNEEISEIK